jgi:hypothetical protein
MKNFVIVLPFPGPAFTGFWSDTTPASPDTGQFLLRLPQYPHFGKTALGSTRASWCPRIDLISPRLVGRGTRGKQPFGPRNQFSGQPERTKPRPDR